MEYYSNIKYMQMSQMDQSILFSHLFLNNCITNVLRDSMFSA